MFIEPNPSSIFKGSFGSWYFRGKYVNFVIFCYEYLETNISFNNEALAYRVVPIVIHDKIKSDVKTQRAINSCKELNENMYFYSLEKAVFESTKILEAINKIIDENFN